MTIECPIHIGQRVRIKQTSDNEGYDVYVQSWRSQWHGEYVVVGLIYEFQKDVARFDVWLASDDEIQHKMGSTCGFKIDDLEILT